MSKYILKPVIVEAVQWFPGVDIQDVMVHAEDPNLAIAFNGNIGSYVNTGDWCVRGPDLDILVYSNEEFHELYEEVFPGYKGQS